MYGYEPDQRRQQGGCREALLLTGITFTVMLPAMAVIMGGMGMIVAAFYLVAVHPALALLPFTPLVAGVVWVVRRDRRIRREMEEQLRDDSQR